MSKDVNATWGRPDMEGEPPRKESSAAGVPSLKMMTADAGGWAFWTSRDEGLHVPRWIERDSGPPRRVKIGRVLHCRSTNAGRGSSSPG